MFPARNVSPILTKSPLSPNTGLKRPESGFPFWATLKLLSRKLWINLQLCLDLDGGRGGTVEQNRKGCDMFLRKEKRHSDELEKVVMKAKINFHSLWLLLWALPVSPSSSFCRWENRPRKITWFAPSHMVTKYRNAFYTINLPLNLVRKLKKQACPSTSALLLPAILRWQKTANWRYKRTGNW